MLALSPLESLEEAQGEGVEVYAIGKRGVISRLVDIAPLERLEVVAEPVDCQDRHNSWGEDQGHAYIEAITERAKRYLVDGRQEVGIQLNPGRDQVQEIL